MSKRWKTASEIDTSAMTTGQIYHEVGKKLRRELTEGETPEQRDSRAISWILLGGLIATLFSCGT